MTDTMLAIIANLLLVQAPDGSVTRWQFSADGRYEMTAPNGAISGGSWIEDGAQFCFTPDGGERACVAPPPAGRHLGDTWQAPDPSGAMLTLTITPRS